MKVEDIKAGSLWSATRKNKFLWRMRHFNIVTKTEDKVSVSWTSNFVFVQVNRIVFHYEQK
ncbi:hypothetical protein [Lactococcus garvieae]|uniref:hypothetical protein n=1 Tax=Lactococcus garvieae TaxID=1363 RepID=UPI003851FA00